MLTIAILINLVIVIGEWYTLAHIRNKRDIFKYYTYLQNFIALIAGMIFLITVLSGRILDRTIPEFVRGMRYIATSGLTATTFIFVVFLGAGKKAAITEEDFQAGMKPQMANKVLHYVCPLLSLVSFVCFERELPLTQGVWTALVAIPSCGYWIVYMILSLTKRWEEPYTFTSSKRKHPVLEAFPFVCIPVVFIAISIVLWNVK